MVCIIFCTWYPIDLGGKVLTLTWDNLSGNEKEEHLIFYADGETI